MTLFRTENSLVDALLDAPNPKPSAIDKAKFGRLASLYTAFSNEFAGAILDLCLNEGCRKIADPFSGMGTVGEAARSRAIDLSLGDISPFAALSGAFRSASRQEIVASADFVRVLSAQIDANDERAYFPQLLAAAGAGTELATRRALRSPTEPEHRATAMAVYLAALSRLRLHKSFAGSNPTWVKRPNAVADGEATRMAVEQTLIAAQLYANELDPIHPENETSVKWAPLAEQVHTPGSLDAIITSPPYPNRTDYIKHYLPASELLLSAVGQDERSLRLEQIGTPLIRAIQPEHSLPNSAALLISLIKSHKSYASENYYYKGFLYYFSDMMDAVGRMKAWLRPGGMAFLVVQDTYYKEIHVPVADLLIDIAIAQGFNLIGRQDWRVRNALSSLSPHSRRSVANRSLSESVIAFSK